MSRSLRSLAALVAAFGFGACAPRGGPAPAVPAVASEVAPTLLFAELERRLLEADSLRLRYSVTSEGAFSASLDGTLYLAPGAGVELEAAGSFGGTPVTLRLRSDEQVMEGGSARRSFRAETPPELRDALILGLTRMGILHNLARLTGGAAPDHAGGGVREWVEVREVQHDAGAAAANPAWVALTFPIHVSGTRTAEATLWVDRATGLPARREQVVTFASGSMRVVERYEFLP